MKKHTNSISKKKPKIQIESSPSSTKSITKVARTTHRSKTLKITKNSKFLLKDKIKYKYKDTPNPQYNNYMEDFGLIIPEFMGDNKKYLFTVLDGHGGSNTAKVCIEHLPNILKENINQNPSNIKLAFTNTFKQLDQKMINFPNEGNTLTCVLINDNILHCANVGDSTCMLVNNEKAYKISFDHKCTEESEMKRIEKEGGKIIDERLNDCIMISRSIGDLDQKDKGMSCEPFYNKINLNIQDNFCVLASDGIWDCINEELLFEIANEVLKDNNINDKADSLCQKLIDSALDIGSQDNISCLVISFE